MAGFVHRQVGIQKFGNAVEIPNNCIARLMYYMEAVTTVLQINDPSITRFAKFRNWYLLSDDEESTLLMLCLLFRADELIGKVFFPSDELCGDHGNQYYSINQVNNILAVQNSVLVGGQQRRVTKIMAFKMSWMQRNYMDPLQELNTRIKRRDARNSQACTIL